MVTLPFALYQSNGGWRPDNPQGYSCELQIFPGGLSPALCCCVCLVLVAQELEYFLFSVPVCGSFGNESVIKSDCPLLIASASPVHLKTSAVVFLVKASCFIPPDKRKLSCCPVLLF